LTKFSQTDKTLKLFKNGGEGGIRTLEACEGLSVFKTGAFNHSATSPALGREDTTSLTFLKDRREIIDLL
tara:strand:- start:551 stop:760 length:210 start_codon:yes stop_codon:yes gene_type:complete